MKFRSLLAIAALALFAIPACEEVANLGEAQINVTPSSITLAASGERSETVALLATREWRVDYKPEWITLDKTSGKASTVEQLITVSADSNKGNNREDEILFTIGLAKASLKVVQEGEKGEISKGSGTLADPFSVAGVIEYCQSLGADVQSTNNVYIKGIIASVATTYEASGTYGNATFYIVDNEGDTDQFYVFQTLYLGNKKWTSGNPDVKEKDEVIICGKVVNYKGNTPETVSKGGSFVYSLNGKTEGGNVEPEDPSKVEQITCAQFIEKADPATTYRLVGKVTSAVNTSYCSFDMNDGTATVVVWTVNNKDEWKDVVKKDGTVTVRGKYLKYEQNGNVKHEMVDAYIEKFEASDTPGGTTESEPKGTGTQADPYNAAGVLAFIKTLEGSNESANDVYIKGKISSIKYTFSAAYGTATFDISDDGTTNGSQFTCYSVYTLGNQAWADGNTQIAVNDEVVICGKVYNYNGTTPETVSKKAYIYSLNGKTTDTVSDVFGVEKTEISVSASATSATINVTGNVAWTAESRDAQISPASGTGKGAITVTFAANESTETAKTYSVVVSTTANVDTKSYTVVITQNKKSEGGEPLTVMINDVKSSFAAETDATYGAGFSATVEGVKIGYYKYNSTSAAVAATDLMKVYKNSALVLSSSQKIASVVLTCTSNYCKDMTPVVGEGTAKADETALTITWTPASPANTIVAAATNAQIRVTKMVITFAK